MLVVDLSDYQPDNLEVMRTAGVGGVIVKASEGLGAGGASHLRVKVAHAEANGFAVLAAYDYSLPDDPLGEARRFLADIAGLPVHCAVIDAEAAGVSAPHVLEVARELNAALPEQTGVYISPGFANENQFAAWPELARETWLWAASWSPDLMPDHPWPQIAPWGAPQGWQFTDALDVPGFGRVDASIFRDDFVARLQGAEIVTDAQMQQLGTWMREQTGEGFGFMKAELVRQLAPVAGTLLSIDNSLKALVARPPASPVDDAIERLANTLASRLTPAAAAQ